MKSPTQRTIALIVVMSFASCFESATLAAETGTRRALIVVGLPGGEEYQEQFVESTTLIRTALTDRFGFAEENIRVLFGRAEDGPEIEAFPVIGRGTREGITEAAGALTEETQAEDEAWVFLIGHSYWDGKTSHFNIPDRDITHEQVAKAFAGLGGKQSLFFICTPVSGFYIKGLSKPNRIIITATEAEAETNASLYHTAVAKTLTEINTGSEFDLDKNGTVSFLDFYIKSTQNLSDLYLKNDPALIATEHPLLDDNGDGSGSELQIDYLTMQQGGRSDAKQKRRLRKFKDGAAAALAVLPFTEKTAASKTAASKTAASKTAASKTAASKTTSETAVEKPSVETKPKE